eukprot:TRINITY_DN3131_c0_g1_i1.p1 TRINITY_DN3131_c0_g1~~TRINITY_DN3131_c0_g1_i1.p1  ORF type:complete len:341 (+),score=58.22 TRINITY_DN3131_c0_g1_i1:118-1140(+)
MKAFSALLLLVLYLSSGFVRGQTLPSYDVDTSQIIAVGLSSGAAMAIQFHVSHSSYISGMASLAGPPYWCAQAEVGIATTACESDYGLISVTELIAATEYAYGLDSIDSPDFLKQSKVWLYTGKNDTVVVSGVVMKSYEYYQHYVPTSSQIMLVDSYPSEHAWITGDDAYAYGNACDYLGTPFINNCDFDSSGALLKFLYDDMAPPTAANPNNILSFDQSKYTPVGIPPATISMEDQGFLYAPTGCQNRTIACKLAVVFHGCEQTLSDIGDTFYTRIGMNEWAESNNIILLYPQAKRSDVPFNPKGCWDWWGYTGDDYATKLGPQVATVKSMLDQIAGTS